MTLQNASWTASSASCLLPAIPMVRRLRTLSIGGDEPLGGGRFAQTQCFYELEVPIDSYRTGVWISHAASERAPVTAIAILCGGRFGARVHHAGRHLESSVRVWCRAVNAVHGLSQLSRSQKFTDERWPMAPLPMNHVTPKSRASTRCRGGDNEISVV